MQAQQTCLRPDWSTFTIRLTPESRSMLGCIMPFSHNDLFIHFLDWDAPFRGSYTAFESINALHIDPETSETEWSHHYTLGAKATSEDNPTLREIQRLQPKELNQWLVSMTPWKSNWKLFVRRILSLKSTVATSHSRLMDWCHQRNGHQVHLGLQVQETSYWTYLQAEFPLRCPRKPPSVRPS
jgi:hypothetical protein